MRKGFTLLLALLLLCFSTTVFAVGDIRSDLTLPKTYAQKAGDDYPMQMTLAFPANYKREIKTLSLSILIDRSLHVENTGVNGGLSDNDYRLTTSKNDESGREIITFVIPDVKMLRGPELTLNLSGKFKPNTKDIDEVKISYVIGMVDGDGMSHSTQYNVTSEKGQPKPSGLHKVDPIAPGDNALTGTSTAGTRIRVFRGKTLIGSGVAKDDGTFSIVINPQPAGAELSFEFNSSKGNETVAVTVGPSESVEQPDDPLRTKMKDYLDILSNANMVKSPHVDQLQVNAAIATAEFALAKGESYQGELAQVQRGLEDAMKVARPGYMSGYPNGTFGPKKAMTRAEVAAVFTRLMNHGEDPATFSSFKDIDDSKWYASSIGYVEKQGLISGYKDGTFKPQQSITRAEFAKILAGFAGLEEAESVSFNDVKSNHWARGYIGAVERAGFMGGVGKNRFAPSEKITRQELCTALNKALYRRPNKTFLDTYASGAFTDVSKDLWSYYEILEAAGEPR
ncbi:MAG: S-layer homology domain-containing protein [Firmicutes bacterium]|nr:S-layer homology domain-containing protein [Bacillota bacterium]